MGNNFTTAVGPIPEAHIRIYKNILQLQSPQTRVKMLETLLAGQEYVASAKQAGIYGPILSYVATVRRGDASFLPGEKTGGHQQPIQRYSEPNVQRPTENRLSTGRGEQTPTQEQYHSSHSASRS